ncbi:hypothetical protein [Pantoea sp. FN0305]|uniref:hypothetical protein n=1 Tax=Pantoea sp. FN0305 TaxID=3418559 RepID=UPI003CF9B2F8
MLSVGASITKSIYTSYELRNLNPGIHNQLRGAGHLDLLYFLVEENLNPFVEAINYQASHGAIDKKIFDTFLAGITHV